ncbi:MAG TPA: chemotaxis protein CheA [Caulobacteraceae bacterium]|nr:chemotaxis protein CheA [Caulobacteraceae bacterium]
MNEFIEQFLLEARELVEQATNDLLMLEQSPTDKAPLDSAFRAFHTLKGSAAIVDFTAMTRALHAAEDVLARVRAGAAPVTPALIGDSLSCLDQVVQWLDQMQADGESPTNADAAADAIVARFAPGAAPDPPSSSESLDHAWVDKLLERNRAPGARARSAVRYAPLADAFFHGEDPLAVIGSLPGLLAIDLEPGQAWAPLDGLDPFDCRLVFTALSTASAEELSHWLRPHSNVAHVRPLVEPALEDALSPDACRLLDAQLRLLGERDEDGRSGRIASAGRVAVNVLRYAGRSTEADQIDQMISSGQSGRVGEALAGAIRAILDGPAIGAPTAPTTGPLAQPAQEARILRVDVERIDTLVNLTGELIVLKNTLGHTTGLMQAGADARTLAVALKDQHARLERLTTELQRSVLGIRVLPLQHVFQRFPRLVRELAASVDKSVRLVTEGDTTEADKAIVESLFEPLLHMVRNALDHGVESAAERAAAGKTPVATIHLRGARVGDQVLIDVEDDGRGIDVDRVRRVAIERGAASPQAIEEMSDEAAAELIFAPGFSTAAAVTDLSGRGVGMDAVRTAIGRLGGQVTLENRPGRGVKVRLTLPFTVMMTRLMVVEAGGEAFGLPMEAVIETVRVPRRRITPIGAARAVVLRGRTFPVIDLAEALGEPRAAAPAGDATLVVVAADGRLGSLEVDRLGERIDVILKPMDGLLAGAPGVAGTTLLGDGRVLIVLDPRALLQ